MREQHALGLAGASPRCTGSAPGRCLRRPAPCTAAPCAASSSAVTTAASVGDRAAPAGCATGRARAIVTSRRTPASARIADCRARTPRAGRGAPAGRSAPGIARTSCTARNARRKSSPVGSISATRVAAAHAALAQAAGDRRRLLEQPPVGDRLLLALVLRAGRRGRARRRAARGARATPAACARRLPMSAAARRPPPRAGGGVASGGRAPASTTARASRRRRVERRGSASSSARPNVALEPQQQLDALEAAEADLALERGGGADRTLRARTAGLARQAAHDLERRALSTCAQAQRLCLRLVRHARTVGSGRAGAQTSPPLDGPPAAARCWPHARGSDAARDREDLRGDRPARNLARGARDPAAAAAGRPAAPAAGRDASRSWSTPRTSTASWRACPASSLGSEPLAGRPTRLARRPPQRERARRRARAPSPLDGRSTSRRGPRPSRPSRPRTSAACGRGS